MTLYRYIHFQITILISLISIIVESPFLNYILFSLYGQLLEIKPVPLKKIKSINFLLCNSSISAFIRYRLISLDLLVIFFLISYIDNLVYFVLSYSTMKAFNVMTRTAISHVILSLLLFSKQSIDKGLISSQIQKLCRRAFIFFFFHLARD